MQWVIKTVHSYIIGMSPLLNEPGSVLRILSLTPRQTTRIFLMRWHHVYVEMNIYQYNTPVRKSDVVMSFLGITYWSVPFPIVRATLTKIVDTFFRKKYRSHLIH